MDQCIRRRAGKRERQIEKGSPAHRSAMASLPPMLPTAFADSSRGALSGTGMPPNAPADSSGGGAVSASPARGLGSPRAGKTLATEGEVDRTRKWEELTEAERSAARVLGYGPEAWDGALVPPGCCESVRPTSPPLLAVPPQWIRERCP